MAMRNDYDVIQYCLRLNLCNPEHLRIHNVMQSLNKDVYKSQNAFIIDSLRKNIDNSYEEDILSDDALENSKHRYVRMRDLDMKFAKFKEEVMAQILGAVFAKIIEK